MIDLLVLMTLDGREVHVNPHHIVSIAEARKSDDTRKLGPADARCVVTMSGGGLIATKEECANVERRLERLKK